jgi:membrane-bound lytic murein transglycosylase D
MGVKLQELCDWNGIKNPRKHKLQVGQELVVRPPTPVVTARAAG